MRAQTVQLRFETRLSSVEYVSERGWEKATLEHCPAHPKGGCGFARHTAYERMEPPGTFVPRWYCPQAHRTFSLLPDCLASRLPGSLAEVDTVVREVEAAPSWETAANKLRPDVGLQAALRWLRRRVAAAHAAARSLIGLRPYLFSGCAPTLTSFASVLQVSFVMIALRGIAEDALLHLPPPLGFGPRPTKRWSRTRAPQQDSGADSPPQPRYSSDARSSRANTEENLDE